ncbi:solute carrier family 2, facilitated glucose transporter member 6-like [Scleropages formosus]|uniref:Solute carrier family 2, facilitated glucose transporter member 8 n=1 Tax=Scleropages formosus TaxID=113540 RepID=A0A8C9RDE0_SCLFO|nr:solute carrier family 2, facilitated glucose transporter member 6-like [Scleropages formosus]
MDERTPLLNNGPASTSNARLYLAVFSAVLGNFNFGYSLVYPSPVIPYLQVEENPNLRMNTTYIAWFGSVFSLGAAAGGLGAMLLNDMIGRKISIMISGVPCSVGYLLMAAAQTRWMLYLGRILTGFASGITAAAIPVYVSEISSPRVRGVLGSFAQVSVVVGSLSLYVLGLLLPWRWLAVAGELPALLMLVLLCFMPKSPRYLISKGRQEEALKALEWLRGRDANFIAELKNIEKSISSQGNISWSDLAMPYYYKPIVISVIMWLLQQMTGITPILVYLEPIFHRTKVTLEPRYDAALVALVRLLSVMIAASLMDRAGRKRLLFTSGFLMFLACQALTIYTHTTPCPSINITHSQLHTPFSILQSHGVQQSPPFDPITVIPLLSTMVIIFGYAMGWGPITWLLMSEILPLGARGKAPGLCVGISWVTAFILTQVFMHVVEAYGLFVPFLFFSVVAVISILFTALYVPETKGRSLEEIENYFRTGRTFTINDN